MLRKAVCPECGSSDIRVKQFIRLDLELADAEKEIDKNIINKESTTVIDDNDSPVTIVYCGECYHEISREVNLGDWFKNKDLTDELCKRLDELEQFRTDTFAKEFRAEIDAHDFSDQYHQIERLKGNSDGYRHTEDVEDTSELIERLFGVSKESEEESDDTDSDDTDSDDTDSTESDEIAWDYSENS